MIHRCDIATKNITKENYLTLDEKPLFVTVDVENVEVQNMLPQNTVFQKNGNIFIYQNKITACKIAHAPDLMDKRFNFALMLGKSLRLILN